MYQNNKHQYTVMDNGHRNNVKGSSKNRGQKKKIVTNECDEAVILFKL